MAFGEEDPAASLHPWKSIYFNTISTAYRKSPGRDDNKKLFSFFFAMNSLIWKAYNWLVGSPLLMCPNGSLIIQQGEIFSTGDITPSSVVSHSVCCNDRQQSAGSQCRQSTGTGAQSRSFVGLVDWGSDGAGSRWREMGRLPIMPDFFAFVSLLCHKKTLPLPRSKIHR